MASKSKTQYQCAECAATSPKWSGQCSECGAWNSLSEVTVAASSASSKGSFAPTGYAGDQGVKKLGDVSAEEIARITVGSGELDRVLGGGLVGGAVILVGGDPGIGKSTLLLQTMAFLHKSQGCLYVTGEESLQQVSGRANRMSLDADGLDLMAETCVERIITRAEELRPKVMVVDSIQTIFTESLSAAPGAVSQLRESAAQLVRFAKRSGTSIWLVGHVTKEGAIAGPRVLEHMVDTVLYFENDASSRYRVIRSVKNRFGAANELGVFAMLDNGLKEVKNPSAIFLSRHEEAVPGSAVMVAREGSRPLLVEIQALVDEAFGNARRVSLGLEQNRLAVLLAVMNRHAGVAAHGQDVFVNVVGGVRLTETATDLAVSLACLSSLRDKPLPTDMVVFGEVGLAGEIRPVPHGEERLREASKHGFKSAIIPKANVSPAVKKLDIKIHPVSRLDEAFAIVRDS